MPKTDLIDSGVGAIHYGQIYTRYGASTQSTISFVAPETAARLAKANTGDVILTNTSENLEDVCKALTWLGKDQIVTGGHATIIKHSMDPRYLSYWLQSPSFFEQKKRLATGTKVIDVSAKQLAKVLIPVPPMKVQREIADILDQFVKLEAELKAELEARRRQYEHYRQLLLTPADTTNWSTLGAVSTKVSSGGTPPSGRADYYGGDIPWLRTQDIDYIDVTSTSMFITEAGLKNSSAKWVPAHCVIVAMYGATAAKTAVNAIPLTTNQACCNLQIDPAVADYRYVFYWVSNEYERLKAKGEGSQSNLNATKVKDYPIPVPSLNRQREIVKALDCFNDLTSSLSVGLPAELRARSKQYEYYRNKLLAFDGVPA
jgi:type I restriction enzyme, S subunit